MTAAPRVDDFQVVPTGRALRLPVVRSALVMFADRQRAKMLDAIKAGELEQGIVHGLLAVHVRTQLTTGRDNDDQAIKLRMEVRDVGQLVTTLEARRTT